MRRIAGIALFLVSLASIGQTAKPVRVIVPWPAGGTVDGVARVLAPKFSEGLGRALVVENRAGAGGSIGEAEAAKAPGDGTTILFVFDTHAVNHLLYKNLGYDPFKSFEHVSLLVTLAAGAGRGEQLRAFERRRAGGVCESEPRQGDLRDGGRGQLEPSERALALGTDRHRDDPRALQGRRADDDRPRRRPGERHVRVGAAGEFPQVKAGRIKALAIGSASRIPQLPDTPTVAETLPGFAAQSWVGMLVPAGASQEVIARYNSEVKKALADPEVRGKLAGQGFDVVGSSPAEFLAFARAESEKWAKVIRDYNIRVE